MMLMILQADAHLIKMGFGGLGGPRFVAEADVPKAVDQNRYYA